MNALEELYAYQLLKYNDMQTKFILNNNFIDETQRENQRLFLQQQKTLLDILQLCISNLAISN